MPRYLDAIYEHSVVSGDVDADPLAPFIVEIGAARLRLDTPSFEKLSEVVTTLGQAFRYRPDHAFHSRMPDRRCPLCADGYDDMRARVVALELHGPAAVAGAS